MSKRTKSDSFCGGLARSIHFCFAHRKCHARLGRGPRLDASVVDAQDSVAYFNRLDKEKLFVRSRSVIGRKVVKCHPGKSVDKVEEIVNGFKSGELDKAEFWIELGEQKILIRYFPVRDQQGEYLGVLEVTQEISEIQKLTGEKRLLDL